jgi:hypothetical protein
MLYVYIYASRKIYGYGGSSVGRGGVLFQYHYVLGRSREKDRDHPKVADTQVICSCPMLSVVSPHHFVSHRFVLFLRQAACNALKRDFTVGTTEDMDSLIVLIALENG